MAILSELQEQEAALYDVFLSFRGTDTRLTFIDHLNRALINENIVTFLDEDDVETGEELKPELVNTIKRSHASIIVLSKNYASSTWCLDELEMILEQRKASNHIVLPIFYHVEPTHVRKQEGSFGKAMATHKQRFDAEEDQDKKRECAHKLKLWENGLTQIADLKGKNANGRKETELIEEIIKEIKSRLGTHLKSNKLPHLIGMGSSINTITWWLKDKSSNAVDILTIWGMAGIGKTSWAEYIYKLHGHEFEISIFIEGIERNCGANVKIEKALFNKKALVVLDGIDDVKQLDELIPTKGFHTGSKIIITTKDGSLTEKCALLRSTFAARHRKYKLSVLRDPDSLSLLCWHAFGSNGPKEGYEQEAVRLARYCGGHPLALKVLGGSLINEDVATWSDIFEMLETKEFYTDIQKVLKVSFDLLPSKNCQELFKHIACFFVGKDCGFTETILKECGIRTSYGITKLIDRCLLTVGDQNELMMHQLVQEMGRDLVRQESVLKPWKRSRLWDHEECLKLLKEETGTSKTQGLVLDMNLLEKEPVHRSNNLRTIKFQDVLGRNFGALPLIHSIYEFFIMIWRFFAHFFLIISERHYPKVELRTNSLTKMDKLNLLQLNHVKLKGSYKNFPKGLRWLSMQGFQLKYIPSELPMENLVALDMSYSNLEQLWKKPKLLRSLKILNISYSKFVKVGGFSELPSLERLTLAGCASLVEVCESIGQCDKLVFLDMSGCPKLKKVPRSISKLKNIKALLMGGCICVNKSTVVENMELREIQVLHSVSSKSNASPYSLTKSPKPYLLLLPTSLVSLSLVDNNLVSESFPMGLSSLSMLNELFLDGNPIDYMPDFVRSLSRLELLSFNYCFMLKSILCPPSTIRRLDLENCRTLETIVFHPEMLRLSLLNYLHAESLKEIEGTIKFHDLALVDEKILCSLGWISLHDMIGQHVQIDCELTLNDAKKLPIKMCYEFGIFSTYFVGEQVPSWLAYRSEGSSISISMRSSKNIRGLNISSVHTCLGTSKEIVLVIKIRNVTKARTWVYFSAMCVTQEADEDIVWLSHWMLNNNEFEDGDEVYVSVFEDEEDGIFVKQCAISPMYTDSDNEDDPLSYYKSWKQIIGGDLSYFQLTSEEYFLFHLRSVWADYIFELNELFDEIKAVERFFGYKPQYKRSL